MDVSHHSTVSSCNLKAGSSHCNLKTSQKLHGSEFCPTFDGRMDAYMAFPHFWLPVSIKLIIESLRRLVCSHKSDMGCASNLGVVPQDRELVHAQYLDTAEACALYRSESNVGML